MWEGFKKRSGVDRGLREAVSYHRQFNHITNTTDYVSRPHTHCQSYSRERRSYPACSPLESSAACSPLGSSHPYVHFPSCIYCHSWWERRVKRFSTYGAKYHVQLLQCRLHMRFDCGNLSPSSDCHWLVFPYRFTAKLLQKFCFWGGSPFDLVRSPCILQSVKCSASKCVLPSLKVHCA